MFCFIGKSYSFAKQASTQLLCGRRAGPIRVTSADRHIKDVHQLCEQSSTGYELQSKGFVKYRFQHANSNEAVHDPYETRQQKGYSYLRINRTPDLQFTHADHMQHVILIPIRQRITHELEVNRAERCEREHKRHDDT